MFKHVKYGWTDLYITLFFAQIMFNIVFLFYKNPSIIFEMLLALAWLILLPFHIIFFIKMIVHCTKNDNLTSDQRTKWLILLVFFNIMAAIFYYIKYAKSENNSNKRIFMKISEAIIDYHESH